MTHVIYDYASHAGPWCVDHKSSQCEHAISEIAARKDVEPLASFIENIKPGSQLEVAVPLWTSFYMWEHLMFVIRHNPALGAYGELVPRGKMATFDLGVTKLLRGEGADDLSRTLVQQFEDIMELDRPNKLPGCRSGTHGLRYQTTIEKYARESNSARLMPHLYGLLGREVPMCAFCWADSYGNDARRVSGSASEAAKADDYSDLLFQG